MFFQVFLGIVRGMSGYIEVEIVIKAVLEDWRGSLMAHTWLDKDGRLKAFDVMSEKAQADLMQARKDEAGGIGDLPILGIGITDCVEICTGTARLMMQAARGDETALVRIRPSQETELKKVIAT